MKQATTWTYYAIARKDWALVSVERFETVEEARAVLIDYMVPESEEDYRGDYAILRYEEVSIWDENSFLMKEVRTTLAELIKQPKS